MGPVVGCELAHVNKTQRSGDRDYVFIYSGDVLRSVVKQKYKLELPAPGQPGVSAKIYYLYRDPREESPLTEITLWASASFQGLVQGHMMQIGKYPHAKVGTGRPYSGIENLRPESIKMVDAFMSWSSPD